MMAKDLKNYLNKKEIKNTIIEDFKKETNVDIKDLSIKFICDNAATLQSNFIDNKLDIFSNSINRFCILFDITIDKKNEEEFWYIKPYFSFIDKRNVVYKIDIFSKEDLLIYFYYKYENEKITIIPREISNGFARVIFDFNTGENKRYYYFPTLDLLTIRGICRKIFNCTSFSIEVYNNGSWETINIDKENLKNCKDILMKNSTSEIVFKK